MIERRTPTGPNHVSELPEPYRASETPTSDTAPRADRGGYRRIARPTALGAGSCPDDGPQERASWA